VAHRFTRSRRTLRPRQDNAGDWVALDETDLIWGRRFAPAQRGVDDAGFLTDQWNAAGWSLAHLARTQWIDRPRDIIEAENKALQLRCAHEAGFRVPRTLISQDFEQIGQEADLHHPSDARSAGTTGRVQLLSRDLSTEDRRRSSFAHRVSTGRHDRIRAQESRAGLAKNQEHRHREDRHGQRRRGAVWIAAAQAHAHDGHHRRKSRRRRHLLWRSIRRVNSCFWRR
jgi:hypothetical protein